MKHTVTSMLAILSAAGIAGIAQAQTTAPSSTPPAQSFQGAAPSAQYNQPQSAASQTPSMSGPGTAGQANMQPPATMPQSGPTAMQPSMSGAVSSRSTGRDEVMQVQEQLQAQGLYRGPIDGIMGSGTRRGLVQFQRQNGLPPSGTLDPQTLANLSGGGGVSNAGSPSVGSGTPPLGTSAPLGTGTQTGTGAPLGASGQSYNSPSTQGTYTQPSANPQPATR